jgi:hypothetical protein
MAEKTPPASSCNATHCNKVDDARQFAAMMGGIVKRSLAMASQGFGRAIAKAFGLDDATRRACFGAFLCVG